MLEVQAQSLPGKEKKSRNLSHCIILIYFSTQPILPQGITIVIVLGSQAAVYLAHPWTSVIQLTQGGW